MILANPFWLAVLLLLPLPWLIARRKGHLGFTNSRLFETIRGGRFLHLVPLVLLVCGFAALAIALARPQLVHVRSTETFKSRDILVAVDISGSMGGQFGKVPPSVIGETELDKDYPGKSQEQADKNKTGVDPYGNYTRIGERRIDNAQSAVLDFVRSRYLAKANDRIGIFVFDTDQYWSWPLTHDLKMIYRKVRFADAGLGGGTNFAREPSPVDAAAEHFDEMGKSVTKVLIMVTDGEDRIYPEDFERLVSMASKYNLKIYVIGVFEDDGQAADILSLAQATGGTAFRAGNPTDLKNCFETIDKMERSTVNVENSTEREELFYYFAAAAVLLFLLAALGEAIVLNP